MTEGSRHFMNISFTHQYQVLFDLLIDVNDVDLLGCFDFSNPLLVAVRDFPRKVDQDEFATTVNVPCGSAAVIIIANRQNPDKFHVKCVVLATMSHNETNDDDKPNKSNDCDRTGYY